jgi:hypothetical protein
MVLLAGVTWALLARGNRLTRSEASIIILAYVIILAIFPR